MTDQVYTLITRCIPCVCAEHVTLSTQSHVTHGTVVNKYHRQAAPSTAVHINKVLFDGGHRHEVWAWWGPSWQRQHAHPSRCCPAIKQHLVDCMADL